jgi:two-component system, chemotaxis family, protein-glutamate methylesterase/glutaminase
MIVEDGHLKLIKGPRENRHRPAIDPTFRSAALTYGPRVIGVVLTGMLDDGTSGLMVVRAAGGTAIIQDPATAMFPSMPRSALQRVRDAWVKPLGEIAETLVKLVSEPLKITKAGGNEDATTAREARMAELSMPEIEKEKHGGEPSVFACPECGGVLWEIDQDGLLRFRCRVGHAYTALNLHAEQRDAIEAAMWSGLRALEENASLYRRMAERARRANQKQSFDQYEGRAAVAEKNSETLRNFLVDFSASGSELGAAEEPG